MLFQKEKEDKNQINRLDQKRERRSRRAFFLLSPISRKTLSGKVSLCTFLKKASLTLETAMALPLFFFRSAHAAFFYGYLQGTDGASDRLVPESKGSRYVCVWCWRFRYRNDHIAGHIFLSAHRRSDPAS